MTQDNLATRDDYDVPKSMLIDVIYAAPKIEHPDDFVSDEITNQVVRQFAKKLAKHIEKTERAFCDEYRIKLNVLTDDQLHGLVNARALQMMLEQTNV